MEERLRLLSRAMQAGMASVAVAGVLTGNLTWVPASVVSLFVSEVPSILRKDLKLVLPVELNFLVVLALFLHVVGGFSGFYDDVPGWDHITHGFSASLVAMLGFVAVVTLDKYVDSICLPPRFLVFFLVMFTMAFGVLWEIMEFATDQLLGSRMQYGLDDTMRDLLFDCFGGFIVASIGAHYLRHTTPEHFLEPLDIEEAKERLAKIIKKV